MTRRDLQALAGEVLDESLELSLDELCGLCHVEEELVMEMVTEGVIDPAGEARNAWRFTGIEVRRVQVAMRLTRELDVNLPGAALALDLLDEIEMLRRRLRDI
jgi:chaperone modulatory protein CbpM